MGNQNQCQKQHSANVGIQSVSRDISLTLKKQNFQQYSENCQIQQQLEVKVYQPKCFNFQFTASRMKMNMQLQGQINGQKPTSLPQSSLSSLVSMQEMYFRLQTPLKLSSIGISVCKSLRQISYNTVVKDQKDNCIMLNILKLAQAKKNIKPKTKFSPIIINNDMFIGFKKTDIRKDYNFQRRIGCGSYGDVFFAICKQTQETRAIKALKKQAMRQRNSIVQKTTQIQLLKSMDHPNIVRVYDIYLDKSKIYMVMQNCQGGPLNCFKMHYKQINVKKVMYQLLSAVNYVHSKGYIHRDIKLQNILLYQKHTADKNFFIKLIDFGLCQKFKKGVNNQQKVGGTLGYIAPQVFSLEYNQLSDVWSCGVVMFILLSGIQPFYIPNSHKATIFNIVNKNINFHEDKWNQVSSQAKTLIQRMLQRDIKKRITIEQAMNHCWFKQFKKQRLSQTQDQILLKLENFTQRANNLISLIESYITFKKISSHQQKDLAHAFNCLDTDGNGVIDKQELRQAFQCYLPGSKHLHYCQQIINKIDKNRSGKIDFSQFMVAMFDKSQMYQNQIIEQFFQQADIYKKGFLKKADLQLLLKDSQKDQIQYLFYKLDSNKDNKITLDQFKAYLRKYFQGCNNNNNNNINFQSNTCQRYFDQSSLKSQS